MSEVDQQTGKRFMPLAPIVPAPMEEPSAAVRAWDDFCDRLKIAGRIVLSQSGVDNELMQAETLRYLIRELRAGIEWETEHAIVDFPRFFRGDDSGSGPPGPNIDNTYYSSRVRPDARYRVRIDCTTIGGIITSVTNRDYRNYGDFSLRDFQVGEDGVLEILVSRDKQAGNWLQMPEDGYRLTVRV